MLNRLWTAALVLAMTTPLWIAGCDRPATPPPAEPAPARPGGVDVNVGPGGVDVNVDGKRGTTGGVDVNVGGGKGVEVDVDAKRKP